MELEYIQVVPRQKKKENGLKEKESNGLKREDNQCMKINDTLNISYKYVVSDFNYKIYIINNTMRPKRNLKVSVNDDLNC